ncbi:MAG: hypothetical protein AAF628_10405 [Planctomycetota bacterium]
MFRFFVATAAPAALLLIASAGTDAPSRAGAPRDAAEGFPFHTPFDFKDRFYVENGLDPTKLTMRLVPNDVNCTRGRSKDPTRNQARILEINGGYDSVGSLLFYPAPPAFIPPDAFLPSPRGAEARDLANKFRAFIFPRRDGLPLSPAAANRRQDNVFDTSSGYSTVNPLGLWRITFPRYTDEALYTAAGQAKLDELRARNGTDLDGTPVLKRLSEIEDLEKLGLLELRQRPVDGSAGEPWVV